MGGISEKEVESRAGKKGEDRSLRAERDAVTI